MVYRERPGSQLVRASSQDLTQPGTQATGRIGQGELAACPNAQSASGGPLAAQERHGRGGRGLAEPMADPGLDQRTQRPQANHPLHDEGVAQACQRDLQVPAVLAIPAALRIPIAALGHPALLHP